ncbi:MULTISPECIES: hybrid sensor histidine kinase/response regulator [Niastella]|uniref:PAS domain-containing protein n=1 Tax=Niastella soli TaxID=2821487 RepID=A0ABS3Z5X6_9BACT|nr:ATP-binding protein [Niastella soli]MBO9205152.1 PAS domain-containing protein [Niastella soli]
MATVKPIKLLILEHDENDLELLLYELKKGELDFDPRIVGTKEGFIAALNSFEPDVILSDYSLPGFDGISAFHFKQQICPDVPFIIVSGTIGEENAVELIRNGVTDYSIKDKLFTVIPKIKRAIKEANERREKVLAEQNLRNSQHQLAEAQRISKIGSWELGPEGEMISCSDELYQILDLDLDTILSFKTFMQFVHEDDKPIIMKARENTVATGITEVVQFRLTSQTGVEKYIEARGTRRLDENGISFMGTCQDITEKVTAEKQLANYSEQIARERLEHQRKLVRASIEGQERERAEIGRELHDNINQILAVTKAYVEASLQEKDMQEELTQRSINNLQLAINEIRKISKSLVPPVMDKNGLVDSVQDLIDNIRVVNPFAIKFMYEKEQLRNITPQQQLALYRIVQEQFNNIIKHAQAHNVNIELFEKNNFIDLNIQDDGQGFDPKERRKGVGLSNILSRIELFDGKLEVISSKGHGCTLKVHVPKMNKEVA